MDLSLVYISQGNIPSRWAHTIQTMKMSEALAGIVGDFCLLTQASGSGTKRPEIDFLGWYGIREPFRIVQLPGARPNRAGYFEKVWYPDFDEAAVEYCSRLLPDLVYTRSPNAGRLAVTAGIPTIVEAHGDIDDPQFKHLLGMIGEQAFLGVVTITPELQQHYADAGIPGEKIRVFPDAVDVEAFADPGPRATWRREFGVDDAAFVATYCGHLYEDKGIEVLLECAGLLPEVTFLILGGWDRDAKRLRRRARRLGNVDVRGFVENALVPRYLGLSDVLLMPYTSTDRNAGRLSPLKLFEYMAAARPIIASDLPSLRYHLRDDDNALLVPPDEAQSLATAISDLQASPERAARLGAAARQSVQGLTWTERARAILGKFL